MDNRERTSEPTTTTKGNPPTKKKRKRKKQGNKFLMGMTKWLFILFCFVSSTVVGVAVGYGVLGEGSISEIFDLNMWKHLYQLAFGS
ncbi:DNA-directed RNA polymerase subunit beta [Caldalkalibacillus mannanilyticus]|uniref:DNA-directed RNA polymerase subunit beta n=1 Tax=Caldalkalibacillus mannanilyticus TaxID=1418 RepID=UPI00046AAD77|nr:DNA-directed RNA polymerase subunit beta [Caldalkalibacillus mannanilyticus]